MKKLFFVFCALLFVCAAFYTQTPSSAQETTENALPSPNIVISQFQVAGGTANDEFIELHNIGSSSVDLNGHRLV
ncbi:MAG TPA: lamin tail domain-containing protein, partial [Pyrinomonadaceae bacterium]|nr:lamin tail domain-containing protein [Pyrinomonadaceae bacterium]